MGLIIPGSLAESNIVMSVQEVREILNVSEERVVELIQAFSDELDKVEEGPGWDSGGQPFATATILAETPQEEQLLAFWAGLSYGLMVQKYLNKPPK